MSTAPNLSPRKDIGLVLQGVGIQRRNTRTPLAIKGLLRGERAHNDFMSLMDPTKIHGWRCPFPPGHALLTLCSVVYLGTLPSSVADYVWDVTGCFSLLLPPVDGKWQAWGVWGSCTTTCGGGTQRRDRVCYGPFFGGETCQGPKEEYKQCNDRKCPGMYPEHLTVSFEKGDRHFGKSVVCQKSECNKEL